MWLVYFDKPCLITIFNSTLIINTALMHVFLILMFNITCLYWLRDVVLSETYFSENIVCGMCSFVFGFATGMSLQIKINLMEYNFKKIHI